MAWTKKSLKNIFISIVPLHPDSLDVATNRVVIELDSGHGQMNLEMMVCLCLQGFYIYPAVPNNTSVSQEADRQYSLTKTRFHINLSDCCSYRLLHNKLLNFAS